MTTRNSDNKIIKTNQKRKKEKNSDYGKFQERVENNSQK